MAKPLPKLTIPPSSSGSSATSTNGAVASGRQLSEAQIRALWIQAGGAPQLASMMAAIAMAESTGRVNALNNNPATGDYSVGLWQINYYGDLKGGRTKTYGSSDKLRTDPLANAKAAVALARADGSGIASNWHTTVSTGSYKAFLKAQTPEEKAAQAAADAQAKAENPNYIQATTDLSTVKASAVAAAKATAHISDPWVTVTRNSKGIVTGFGSATGPNAPKNVLLIGGVPATQSLYQQQWGQTYANDFAAYTGRLPTPAEQADILTKGISVYQLRNQLSLAPSFKSSPAYKQSGAGVIQAAKDALGKPPPDDFVRKAIAENWDANTFDANLRALPQYTKGPVYQKQLTGATDVYTSIYGSPSDADHAWLKSAALAGWDQNTIATKLRQDPAYKFSGEYEGNVMGMLDKLGLLIGAQPALSPVKTAPGRLKPPPSPGSLAPTVLGLKPTLQGGASAG